MPTLLGYVVELSVPWMSEAQPDTAMADADVSDHDRILQRGQPSKVGARARIRRWAGAPPLTGNDARFAFLYGAQESSARQFGRYAARAPK